MKPKNWLEIPPHDPSGFDIGALKRALANRLTYTVGKDGYTATDRDWLDTLCYAVRDRLIEGWMETQRSYYHSDAKRVYYLSLEFLIGRTLYNALLNLEIDESARKALAEIGLDLETLREQEFEAGLGNGGLGRLAACFLDAMATLGIPGVGYGIRYEYGMFHQNVENGQQTESPDPWLCFGNPWEFPRPEVIYPVQFNGYVNCFRDAQGHTQHHWVDTEVVNAMAYDMPVPGYGNDTVNNLRLWSAKATHDFDLRLFNSGNYINAVEEKTASEKLSKVLYPDDSTEGGRTLRLKQEYFFASASLQDILFRYLKTHKSFDALPDKVAIQLNDTHPAIAIPELMRLLIDTHHLGWEQAWDLTLRTFSYTNHTLMPEALESWSVNLFGQLLPRHLEIIQEINHHFLKEVRHRYPGNEAMVERMSIFDESHGRRVRMAHLAVVGSHRVNGVSELHSQLMRESIFADFHRMNPNKILNMTNGITQRRWLNQANPRLSKLITGAIGNGWLKNLEELKKLTQYADHSTFQSVFLSVKTANKADLAKIIHDRLGFQVDPNSLFDVQVKRIHEYKRQLLNLLHVVTRYNRLRSGQDLVPRTIVFAGKAAPGYARAKLIIRLIHAIADVVNNDPATRGMLKLAFIPNYNVTTAGDIIPAADLSEQISTAGTEASGTGNMKLALNGALTIGTLDGANVEIRDEVGEENIFLFGLNVDEVKNLTHSGYCPGDYGHASPELVEALDMIGSGYFSPESPGLFRCITDSLWQHDPYLLMADYASYIACQERVDALYCDPAAWTRRAILNVANMGKFSADRTISEYAEHIWRVTPVLPGVQRRKRAKSA
ncbi:MAG: glycogen/starch/alpha-glucan phosphorylase [Gammaproteobacteria bacterium]